MHVTLLGTGTSVGIPVLGCSCRVCRSDDPRDQRSRCACLVEVDGLSLLIDAGPDFRQQALREQITRLDAVLFTHHHADHIVGIDDLRPFFFENRTSMPCYARANTAAVLRRMFSYIFERDGSYASVPLLDLYEVEAPFTVYSRYMPGSAVEVIPIDVRHGTMPIYGYRIGGFAYLTDTNAIPTESYALLDDLDVLVLDALRHEPHPTHFSIDEALTVAQRINARQTYLTHMTHTILHAEQDACLPDGIALGYDGLSFEVQGSRFKVPGFS